MRHIALAVVLAPVVWLLATLLLAGASAQATSRIPLVERFRHGMSWGNLTIETGALNLDAADAVLKDDYKSPVVETLNNANVLLAQLERNTTDFTGKRWVRALHVGRNRGTGNRATGDILPTPYNQRYDNTYGPTRNSFVRIKLEDKTIAVMEKSRGSFIRATDSEMTGATRDGTRNLCRQVWGTSDGKIAVATSNSSTTITLTTPRQDQLLHLDDGFLIEIRDTTGVTVKSPAGGLAVHSVDYDAGTFVIENPDGSTATAVTIVSGDIICAYGAYGVSDNSGSDDDGQIELTGAQTILSATATLHTLAPATEPRWAARVWSNSGTNRAISENLVSKAIMQGQTRSGQLVDLLVGSDGVFRSYGNLLTTLRRTVDDVKLKGGYTGLSHSITQMGRGGSATVALAWDPDCPDNSLAGFHTPDISVAELMDWDWMDRDGHVLHQEGATTNYTATLRCYKDVVCERRNSHFLISDVAVS